MAYDNSKEIRKELASIALGKGEFLKVAYISKEGKDGGCFDIRRWYTDKNNEVMPTQKGVRLADEVLVDVMTCIANEMSTEELFDFANGLDRTTLLTISGGDDDVELVELPVQEED